MGGALEDMAAALADMGGARVGCGKVAGGSCLLGQFDTRLARDAALAGDQRVIERRIAQDMRLHGRLAFGHRGELLRRLRHELADLGVAIAAELK